MGISQQSEPAVVHVSRNSGPFSMVNRSPFEESDRADVPFRAELRTSQRPNVRLSSGRDILTTGGYASRGIHV